jgi:predicted PurR-regulated permease PerM
LTHRIFYEYISLRKEVFKMKTSTGNSSIIGVLIGGAGLFIIIFGMKLSASIISPILLAVVIGISVSPLMNWLVRKGVAQGLALLFTIVVIIVGVVGLIALIGFSVNELVVTLPKYEDNLQGQKEALQTALGGLGIADGGIHTSLQNTDPSKLLNYVGSLFAGILGFLSGLVIMLMVLIFLLLATPGLTTKLSLDFSQSSPTLARFRGLARDLREYVGITTWINFLVGLVNAIFLFLLGVDFPILWGLLAFLMGYIPSVGFWIALIPPTILAFLEFGTTKALIVLVGYVLINGGVQNFIQPRMMGSGLNLSPLIVVLSLFFWGWILGPMGALLAVPLTMVVKEIFLVAFEDTRGLADLMSADSPSKNLNPDDTAN